MPEMLGSLLGAEVVAHTRGGARLSEQVNPRSRMGAATLASLKDERWDAIVLQEMSNGPLFFRSSFFSSVEKICALARKADSFPVLFGTWAYREGGREMEKMPFTYREMVDEMRDAYAAAGRRNSAPVADVCTAFASFPDHGRLYAPDGEHPSVAGSVLAASVIASTLVHALSLRPVSSREGQKKA